MNCWGPKEFVHSEGNLMWRKCTVFYRARLRGCVCSIQNFVYYTKSILYNETPLYMRIQKWGTLIIVFPTKHPV